MLPSGAATSSWWLDRSMYVHIQKWFCLVFMTLVLLSQRALQEADHRGIDDDTILDAQWRRGLSNVECDQILIQAEVPTIRVTDQIWDDISGNLQRLVTCLPERQGGVLEFETTRTLTPSSGTFFERRPVVITTVGAQISRTQGTVLPSDKVVFSCPEAMKSRAFMGVSNERVVLDNVLITGCNLTENQRLLQLAEDTELVLRNTVIENIRQESASGVPVIFANSGSNLEVEKSTFQGISGAGVVGLSSAATAIIKDSEFEGNSALEDGGVVYAFPESRLEVVGTSFSNNSALAKGGVVYADDASAEVEKCTFTNNQADDGGAIYFKIDSNSSTSSLMVKDSSFVLNSANSSGGCMHISGFVEATIKDVDMRTSTASHGGAVSAKGSGRLQLTNILMEENSASANGGGGVLESEGGDLKVLLEQSTMSGNSAEMGGAFSLVSSVELEIVSDTNFVENTASKEGGAVYMDTGSSLFGTGSNFSSNEAVRGGAIFMKGDGGTSSNVTLTLQGSQFNANTGEEYGGGIAMSGAGAKCGLGPDVDFIENSAEIYGGGLAASNGSDVDIVGAKFMRNKAEGSGGAILCRNVKLDVANSMFVENEGERGGAVEMEGSETNAIFADTDFLRNSAMGSGGGVFISEGPSAEFKMMVFRRNVAKLCGGGMAVEAVDEKSEIQMTESTFDANMAKDGGGLCVEGGDAAADLAVVDLSANVKFISNVASESGGGLILKEAATVSISEALFRLNDATVSGGGASIQAGKAVKLTMEGTKFVSNSASSGGGMHLVGGAQCNLTRNVKYEGNFATQGGALLVSGENTILWGNDTKFTQNSAAQGGAISASELAVVRFGKSSFEGNQAQLQDDSAEDLEVAGGAIWTTSSVMWELLSSRFWRNTANGHGGALLVDNLASLEDVQRFDIVCDDIEFLRNTAVGKGGAVAIIQANTSQSSPIDHLHILNSLFKNNSAAYGGAMWIAGGLRLVTLEKSVLRDNTAIVEAGGLGFHDIPNSVLKAVKAIGNKAGTLGGALSLQCSGGKLECKATVSSTEFLSNSAGGVQGNRREACMSTPTLRNLAPDPPRGGGVRVFGDGMSLKLENGCVFKANTAMEGGAMYCHSAQDITVSGSRLEDNRALFGGSISVRGLVGLTKMIASTMTRNEACKGGGLYIDITESEATEPVVRIQNMVFKKNKAWHDGGAVYATTTDNIGICCNCKANVAVPRLKPLDASTLDYLEDECKDSWSGNKAVGSGHGDSLASPAVEVVVEPLFVVSHPSGRVLPMVNVSSLDLFGQAVPAPGVFVRVSADRVTIKGQRTSDLYNGRAAFEGTIVEAPPGSYNLTYTSFSSDASFVPRSLLVGISITPCQFGEFVGDNDGSCQRCPAGTFNFGNSSAGCKECPDRSSCNGTVIVPDDGYWHSSVYSTRMHECLRLGSCSWEGRKTILSELSAAAMSSVQGFAGRNLLDMDDADNFTAQQCAQGYGGPVCGSCIDDHVRVRSNECSKCKDSTTGYYIAIGFLMAWFLFLAAVFYYHGWRISLEIAPDWQDAETEPDSDGINPHPEPMVSGGAQVFQRRYNRYTKELAAASQSSLGKSYSDMARVRETEMSYTNPGPSISGPSNTSKCEIEADVNSAMNPPSVSFTQISNSRGEADLSQISVALELEDKDSEATWKQRTRSKASRGERQGEMEIVEAEEMLHDEEGRRRGMPLEVIKILINFMQVTSLAIFIDTDWIEGITRVFQIQDIIGAGGDGTIPFGCTLTTDIALRKSALTLGFPIAVAALAVVFWMLSGFCCCNSMHAMVDKWILSLLTVMYIAYTSLTYRSLKLLNCVDIGDGEDIRESPQQDFSWAGDRYWTEDTSVKCFEGSHNKLATGLAVPLLVAVTAGLPLWMVMALLLNRNRLQDPMVLRKYGFFYQSYRDGCAMWEALVFLRKATLGVILVFGYNMKPELQSILATAVLMLALFLHLWVWPYQRNCSTFNRMEALSLFTSSLAFYTVLLIQNEKVGSLAEEVLSVLVVVFSVAITLYMLVQLVKELIIGLDWDLARLGAHTADNLSTRRKIMLLYRRRMTAVTHKSRSGLRNLAKYFW